MSFSLFFPSFFYTFSPPILFSFPTVEAPAYISCFLHSKPNIHTKSLSAPYFVTGAQLNFLFILLNYSCTNDIYCALSIVLLSSYSSFIWCLMDTVLELTGMPISPIYLHKVIMVNQGLHWKWFIWAASLSSRANDISQLFVISCNKLQCNIIASINNYYDKTL